MTVLPILGALQRRRSTLRVLAVGCAHCGAWTNPRRPCAAGPATRTWSRPAPPVPDKEVNP